MGLKERVEAVRAEMNLRTRQHSKLRRKLVEMLEKAIDGTTLVMILRYREFDFGYETCNREWPQIRLLKKVWDVDLLTDDAGVMVYPFVVCMGEMRSRATADEGLVGEDGRLLTIEDTRHWLGCAMFGRELRAGAQSDTL